MAPNLSMSFAQSIFSSFAGGLRGLGPINGKDGLPRWCQCRRCKRCGFDSWVEKIPWRRKWQPTPIFLLGKSQGQRSLPGCSAWGHKEWDMTDWPRTCAHTHIHTHTHTHTHTHGKRYDCERQQCTTNIAGLCLDRDAWAGIFHSLRLSRGSRKVRSRGKEGKGAFGRQGTRGVSAATVCVGSGLWIRELHRLVAPGGLVIIRFYLINGQQVMDDGVCKAGGL